MLIMEFSWPGNFAKIHLTLKILIAIPIVFLMPGLHIGID